MQTSLDILLVEDNEGDVIAVKRAFRDGKPACRISVANDGMEALDFLHRRGRFVSATLPQLILLDLNMPRMDGKEFLEVMKAESQLKAIPVVMLTSSQSPADIRGCYERHASCYVAKPFDSRDFTAVLKQIANFWNGIGMLPEAPLQHKEPQV